MDDLRRFAVARSLFPPTTLRRAIARMGFIQADPIRAPARAQDLILRHRAKGYRAGDLDRNYVSLGVEEDTFVNYGFVTRELRSLMHPRPGVTAPADGLPAWSAAEQEKARLLLEFVGSRGEVHPREVEEHFAHGRVRNYWGGASRATTQMLEGLHYRGLVRVARRENGTRIYRGIGAGGIEPGSPAASLDQSSRRTRLDTLVDAVINIYAPLPASSLSSYIRRLRYAVPQWRHEIPGALQRARARLGRTQIAGTEWYWPNDENPRRVVVTEKAYLLAPFDPVVHDRRRFELLWDWSYRFEAYTPAPKRKLGYYALPLLWRDRVVGWANFAAKNDAPLHFRTVSGGADIGYVQRPGGRDFTRELKAELERIRTFLRPRI